MAVDKSENLQVERLGSFCNSLNRLERFIAELFSFEDQISHLF